MFIELTEYLRCPEPHPDAHCVLLPEAMVDRRVIRGAIGCPVCRREYPIRDGVVEFGVNPEPPAGPLPEAATVCALLGLTSPGGFVALVGSWCHLEAELAGLMDGVHLVGINPPSDVVPSPYLSLLRSERVIPLRTAVMRGVAIGIEHVRPPWIGEGVRVVLRGQRLVLGAREEAVPGVETLAADRGLFVGRKTD